MPSVIAAVSGIFSFSACQHRTMATILVLALILGATVFAEADENAIKYIEIGSAVLLLGTGGCFGDNPANHFFLNFARVFKNEELILSGRDSQSVNVED